MEPDFLNRDAANVTASATIRYGMARHICNRMSLRAIVILLSLWMSLPRLSQ